MTIFGPPSELDLWVLAGQSNMVGRGSLRGALTPHDRVWSFASNGRWEIASDPLHRPWESFTPVHQQLMRSGFAADQQRLPDEHWGALEREIGRGAGLGIAFGTAMTQSHGRAMGLIPCAHGGTALAQWSPALAADGASSLYGAMLERIRRAREVGPLKGILWYQGESDALNLADAESYARRFDEWIHTVRSDTGINNLPVIVVQLGRLCEQGQIHYDGADLVRRALGEVADRITATAATTSALDLGLSDDCHINPAGLIRLGRRLARVAIGMTDQPNATVGPRVIVVEKSAGELSHQHAVDLILSGVTGKLSPAENLSGFSVHDDDSSIESKLQFWSADVVNNDCDAANTARIRLLLSRTPTATMRVAYGQGPAPYCNVVDEADMPLCAFAPRSIRLTIKGANSV